MIIALSQMRSKVGDLAASIAHHEHFIQQAANNDAALVLFPELSLIGYEPAISATAQYTTGDPDLNKFQMLADQFNIIIGVGLPLRKQGKPQIGTIYFNPQGTETVYSKQFLHEDEFPHFSPGDAPVHLLYEDHTIAPAICYESMLEEHVSLASTRNSTIYLISAAKSQEGIRASYELYPQMARKYKLPYLLCNSVGTYTEFAAWGSSGVWDADGNILGKLNESDEGLLFYDTESKNCRTVKL